jgi:hypothetical protein
LTPVLFAPSVRLTKGEGFSACQALADADRWLVRAGRPREAGALGDLFELLEARMVADDPPPTETRAGGAQSSVGSYSIDSEFTQ